MKVNCQESCMKPVRNISRKRIAVFVFTLALWAIVAVDTTKSASSLRSYEKDTVSVNYLAERYWFQSLNVKGKEITLKTRYNTLKLEGNSRKAYFNDILIWLNGSVKKKKGKWHICQIDVDTTILPLISPPSALQSSGYKVVVIDPGHGGKDKGAVGRRRNVEEKRTALDIARRVEKILKKKKVNVRLTRRKDRQVSLANRCAMANSWKADLLVSIHLNASRSSVPSGIETHIVPPAGCRVTGRSILKRRDHSSYPGNRHDKANMFLGYVMQKNILGRAKADDRGIRRSRFYVIKNVSCPAVLVECGFLSNRKEESKFISRSYRNVVAQGIASGILEYLEAVKSTKKK